MDPLDAPGHDSPGAQHATSQHVRHTSETGAGWYPLVSDVSFIRSSAADFHGSRPPAMSDRTRAMSLRVCQPAGCSKADTDSTDPTQSAQATERKSIIGVRARGAVISAGARSRLANRKKFPKDGKFVKSDAFF